MKEICKFFWQAIVSRRNKIYGFLFHNLLFSYKKIKAF